MLGILEALMVVRITSMDWREGWRWSFGLGIQQLELVIEVKEMDIVTKGKNMGEEWRQGPPCSILLLRSSQKKKICQRRGKKKVLAKRLTKNWECTCRGRGQNPQGECFRKPRVRAEQELP